jgi:uncharacterized membrane protein YfcA
MADYFCDSGNPFRLANTDLRKRNFCKNCTWIFDHYLFVYSLFGKKRSLKEDNKLWLFLCGFLSGVFGGAYGLNGPPLVVYGKLRNLSAKHFRATLQAYFLPVSFIGFLGYFAKGLVNSEVTLYFMISLLTSIPAIFLGRSLNHQLNEGSFFKFVYWGLLIVAIVLVVNSLK